MSKRFSIGNGTSGNWGTAHTEKTVKNTNLSINTAIQGVPFTAISTSNYDLGFAFFIGDTGNYNTDREWTVRLYENSSIVATTSFKITEVNGDEDGMMIIKWDSPYQYTTTAANAYYYEIVCLAGSGTADRIMQDDASATHFAYLGFNDVGTTLVTGDKLFIPYGQIENINNTGTIVSDNTVTNVTSSNWESAINICGQLKFDDSGDTSIQVRGSVALQCGGYFGDVTPLINNHTITFDYSTGGSHNDFGFFTRKINEFHFIGTERPHQCLNISGAGTTASPLIIADDLSLVVNDFIAISPTDAVEHTEYKYIRSGTFTTGYILSDISGGVESGFTYTHSDKATIVSLTRNLKITSTDVTKGWHFDENKVSRLTINKQSSQITACIIERNCNHDYTTLKLTNIVNYNANDASMVFNIYTKEATVHSNNIFTANLNQNGGNDYLIYTNSAQNQQFLNNIFLNIQVNTWGAGGVNNGMLNCKLLDCNKDNNSLGGGIKSIGTSANIYLKNCDFQAIQNNNIRIRSNLNMKIESCRFGEILPSPTTFYFYTSIYAWKINVNNCILNDISRAINEQSGLPGSEITYQDSDIQGYTNNEEALIFSTEGVMQKCGFDSSGGNLSDTTTRTSGNHSFALKCETGELVWNNQKIVGKNDGVLFSYYLKTVNYVDGDYIKIEMILPGETVPTTVFLSEEFTDNFQLDWKFGSVQGVSKKPKPGIANIKISTYSSQSDACLYITDINNGENDITGLNVWADARPNIQMYDPSVSPSAIWSTLGDVPVPEGSYGEMITNDMYNGEVHLNVTSSYSGTGWGIGTPLSPVNNLTDAIAILNRIASSTIQLSGSLTLDQSVNGLEFISFKNGKIDINNQSAIATRFRELKISGTQNNIGLFFDCRIANLQNLNGIYTRCSFFGVSPILLGNATTELVNCITQAGSGEQIFDFSNVTNGALHTTNLEGKFKFTNLTSPSSINTISSNSTYITIDSTCTAGMFMVSGIANIANQGASLVVDGTVQSSVWTFLKSAITTVGSIGKHLKSITNNRI